MKNLAQKTLMGAGLLFAGRFIYNTVRDAIRARSFAHSVVVISGGSRGLGLLMGKEFAKEGASLALLARDEAELRRAQNIIQLAYPECLVHYYVCDCTKADEVKKTIQEVIHTFGHIDVLVNNAGVISSMPISNATDKEFEESIATHFWGPYHLIQNCRPHLERGARIVNISSIGGKIPVPHLAPYCTGKFALVGYSETLRAELMDDGIYVTTVCPGLMRTGSVDHATFKGQVKKEYAWFSLISSMPLITVNAERAARQIIQAARVGKAELRISFSTKMAVLAQAHFPEFFSDAISLANLFLPDHTPDKELKVEGFDAHSMISPSPLTKLTNKASVRNNENERPASF
jgi:short-subunit dehydrogenase